MHKFVHFNALPIFKKLFYHRKWFQKCIYLLVINISAHAHMSAPFRTCVCGVGCGNFGFFDVRVRWGAESQKYVFRTRTLNDKNIWNRLATCPFKNAIPANFSGLFCRENLRFINMKCPIYWTRFLMILKDLKQKLNQLKKKIQNFFYFALHSTSQSFKK